MSSVLRMFTAVVVAVQFTQQSWTRGFIVLGTYLPTYVHTHSSHDNCLYLLKQNTVTDRGKEREGEREWDCLLEEWLRRERERPRLRVKINAIERERECVFRTWHRVWVCVTDRKIACTRDTHWHRVFESERERDWWMEMERENEKERRATAR